MKKLLSALTSAVMSITLMTSAFASSFGVSAAGSYTVQPNTAISEAADGAANKNASDADIELGYAQEQYDVAPGETIDLDLMMSTTEQLEVRGMYLSVLVDDGITLNSIEGKSAAFGVSVDTSWTEGGSTYLKDPDFNGNKIHGAIAVGLVDGEGNGAYAKTERRVERLNITAPSTPGTYYVDMPTTQFMYKEVDGVAVFWSVNYTPAKIVVAGDTPTTTTTTKPSATTTTTTKAPTGDADIELFYAQDEYKVAPGETIDLDVMMSTKEELEVRGMYLSVLVDDGITLNSIEGKSAAFGVSVDTSWTEGGDTYLKDPDFNGNKIHGAVAVGLVDGEGNGAYAKTERRVERLNVTAPTEPGTYYVNMPTTQFMYKEIDGKAVFWTVNYTPAKIVVEGGEVTTTTTPAATTTTTTTTKPVATTTTPVATTTPTAEPGTHLPGDANCDGKVNIADVVRLNKAIAGKAELSAQGKINADVDYDGDQDATDSTNILKAIVKLVELHMDKAPTDIAY